ncbi:MAG: DUF447 domain-containing protein [Candidatus Thiodiazotropha sp. 6PLUC2]
MIQEVIVTCRSTDGENQIAPMGVVWREEEVVVAPFRPSRTLNNILASECAVINYCDDVRVFAGCLTGRYDWPLLEAEKVSAPRLANALAHTEVQLMRVEEDPIRPRLICKPLFQANHRPFQGFNRAQSAVLELAILVSRLGRLSHEKIENEIAYLTIAIEKTAGDREKEAWDWLMVRVNDLLQQQSRERIV